MPSVPLFLRHDCRVPLHPHRYADRGVDLVLVGAVDDVAEDDLGAVAAVVAVAVVVLVLVDDALLALAPVVLKDLLALVSGKR